MSKILLSLLILFAGPNNAQAKLVTKVVEYNLAGRPMEGYLAYDDSIKGEMPGVLIIHDWMGLTDKTKARADQVAQLGYVAFAADVYGKGQRPKNNEEAARFAGTYKKDRTILRARLQEALAALKKQPNVDKKRIAAMGYCFGGGSALELARAGADLKGVVSFHGFLDTPKPDDAKRIKGKVLALHGADDPNVPPADVAAFEQEMRNAKVDWSLVAYGNAVHAFTDKTAGNDNSKGVAYNEKADKRSWIAMENFFKEVF